MDASAFEQAKRYVGFDQSDADALAGLLKPLAPAFPAVVDRFYSTLFQFPDARAVFSGEAQVERLRRTLLVWLAELFGGHYGPEYLENRCRIGRTHVRVGLAQQYMFLAMSIVRQELSHRIEALSLANGTKCVTALHRMLDLELAIMNSTYREDLISKMQALERAQYEQRLGESEHLATIGQLAASLAHEIKNPLAGISGAIQVIGAEFGEGHPHREVIQEVMRQIDRLDSAVRDLLVYARPKPPSRTRQEIAALMERALILFREEPNVRNVAITCEGFDQLLEISVDDAQFQQVIINVLLNAAHACGPGGRICCRLLATPVGARIEVEDSGVGIKSDVLPRVFEPFFTTKARGTGLGLPICKRIIETHGGTIQIDSVVGQGTRVTIDLPHEAIGGQRSARLRLNSNR